MKERLDAKTKQAMMEMHLSVSRRKHLPTWGELVMVRDMELELQLSSVVAPVSHGPRRFEVARVGSAGASLLGKESVPIICGPYPGYESRASWDRGRKLAVSSPRAMEALRSLKESGVDTLFRLQEDGEKTWENHGFLSYAAAWQMLHGSKAGDIRVGGSNVHAPIKDMSVPDVRTMNMLLDVMDATLALGMGIYVHCWGGHGRTGTVMCCWLQRHAGPWLWEWMAGWCGVEANDIQDMGQESIVHGVLGYWEWCRSVDEYMANAESPQTKRQMDMVRSWMSHDRSVVRDADAAVGLDALKESYELCVPGKAVS